MRIGIVSGPYVIHLDPVVWKGRRNLESRRRLTGSGARPRGNQCTGVRRLFQKEAWSVYHDKTCAEPARGSKGFRFREAVERHGGHEIAVRICTKMAIERGPSVRDGSHSSKRSWGNQTRRSSKASVAYAARAAIACARELKPALDDAAPGAARVAASAHA